MSKMQFKQYETDYKDGYTVVTNNIIVDKNLTDAGKVLLIYLLSNSKTWKVYGNVTADTLSWGRDKFTKTVRELHNAGYIQREQTREKGKWDSYNYQFHNKPVFENEKWETPKSELRRKLPKTGNVAQNQPTPEALSIHGVQPSPEKPDTVVPASENQALPMPKRPMPKRPKAMEAMPSSISSSKAMEASPVQGRKFKRTEEKEETFQYLLGLQIFDEKGQNNEEALSVLAHNYSRQKLEDTYFHLIHKLEDKKVPIKKSVLAFYRYLLDNEHNCRGSNSELNAAFARKIKSDCGWGTLEIKDKYVIDRDNSAKDISLNMEPTSFRDSLLGLYSSLHFQQYGT